MSLCHPRLPLMVVYPKWRLTSWCSPAKYHAGIRNYDVLRGLRLPCIVRRRPCGRDLKAIDPCRIFVTLHNIAFYHLPLVSGIRDLRADKIGTLRSISGTVTRTSEVRPRLLYGSSVCGGLVNEIEQQFNYQ
ncbi:hypothetical protein L210DRAFT_3635166, partial [Boletus edulis BED1]